MSGFGADPFGQEPFGDWNWAKQVLYDFIPELYRLSDTDGLLEAYAAGLAPSYINLRQKIRNFGELRDPLEVRTQYDEVVTVKLGRRFLEQAPIEQNGVRAEVDATRAFVTQRGRFSFDDLGKDLEVYGSSEPLNNVTVRVASLVSPTTILTDPPLVVDAGPVRWRLRGVVEDDPTRIHMEVVEGDLDEVAPGWILSDGFADFTILGRCQFQLATSERRLLTEREGSDGTLNGSGNLVSTTGLFAQRDVGKILTISGSEFFENEGRFEISEVLSAAEAVLTPLGTFSIVPDDEGPLQWAVRRVPELIVQGPQIPAGLVEQRGEKLLVSSAVLGSADVTAPAGRFTLDDVGKLLTIRADSTADSGTYEVAVVSSLTEVTLDTGASTLTAGPTEFFWELRTVTNYPEGVSLEIRAPSLLTSLAEDFAIEVDTREEEDVQRRWVASVSRWIGLKGTEDGYEYLGALTGFEVATQGLYRVSQEIYLAVLVAGGDAWAVGESGEGRSGTDGFLTSPGAAVRLTAASAVFSATDVGRQVAVSGSGSGNDGLRTIDKVISKTEIEFRAIDLATTPDASNGSLVWSVVRLYSEQGPFLPVLDEIDADYMTTLKGAAAFTVDKYCWETDWDTTLGAGDGFIEIDAVTPAVSSPFAISYSVTGARGDFNVVVGLGVGRWKLIDSGATEHFLETVPVLSDTGEVAETDGSLTTAGPDARLTTGVGATFTAADVGKRVTITGSLSANDGTYIISAFISGTEVTLDPNFLPPTIPDANNGALTLKVLHWTFEVVATTPPATGSATLEYVCAERLTCDYCKSNKVLVTASTALVMESPFERLFGRLNQGKPAHVEFVTNVGVETTATVTLSAEVVTP